MRQRIAPAAWLALGCAVLALAAIHLSRQSGSVATVWFANALAIAVLATAPRQRWPLLALAVVTGNLGANLLVGDPLGLALSFVAANLAEVLVGALLLGGRSRPADVTDSPTALLRMLALGAFLPQLVGATLGAAALAGHGVGSFPALWLNWYAGDALGAAAALPFFLTLCQTRPVAWRAQLATLPVAALALLSLGVTLLALTWLPYPFVFMSLPLLAAAALATPLAGFGLVLTSVVVVVAALDYGVFVPAGLGGAAQQGMVLLSAVLALMPAQFLATVIERQRQLNYALSAITSATSELASFIDREGTYRMVNRAYEDYWQRPRVSIVGKRIPELLSEAVYRNLVEPRFKQALGGEVSSYRAAFDFPQHGRRTMDVSYSPARDPAGQVIGVLVLAHDVSGIVATNEALERSNAELRRANEGLEQFARMTSHDLREPLNTIMQFTGLIEREHAAELTAASSGYFHHVLAGAQRMRCMLDDLLEFVRLDQAGAPAQPVALGPLLNQVCAGLAARISQRGAHIELQPLPEVMGTDSLLSALFQNLVSNAIKFVPPERAPEVRIGSVPDADPAYVRVVVADNGIGIAAADQALLFQPFKRLNARRKYEGTGLGLAICHRIAVALGGAISIESVADTVGSRFVVRLRRSVVSPG